MPASSVVLLHASTLALLGMTCVLLGSCLPRLEFPDEPTLRFVDFVPAPDGSAVMTLGFTDGDGNVGLTQADTLLPCTCEHHFNLVAEYQEWNGAWDTPNLLIPYAYRVPVAAHRVKPSLDGTWNWPCRRGTSGAPKRIR